MDNPFLGRSRIYGWTFDEALRNLPSLLPSFFLAGWIFEDYVGEEISFRKKIVISSIDRVSLKNLIIIMMMM